MAEQIKGFSIELSLDSIKVDAGLQDLKRSMRQMNSETRSNMSAFDRGEKSLEKYGVQLGGLNKKLELQKKTTESARTHYEKMVKAHGEGSKEAQNAAIAYNNESAQLKNLERYIGNVTNEMNAFKKQQDLQSTALYKTGDALQGFGTGLGEVSAKARDVGWSLTKKLTLPALGVATAVGGMFAKAGWDRLVGLDSAQAKLKGLGYTTEDVGRISDQVTRAIEGGMTTMAEGVDVAAGAMAAGVKEGKDLEKYIQLVGDAAVGANRPVDEMAQIFNRVQGSGRLMTQELNQVEHGMPGFSQAMAKHLGVGTDEFRKMVTAGKVSSKDFLTVMDDFAGGMAEAYSQSWAGMVANTKAYIGILGENLMGGVFEKSKESIGEFIELLKSEQAQIWAENAGKVIGEAFTIIIDKVKGAIAWYTELDDSTKKLITGTAAFAVAIGPVILGLSAVGTVGSKVAIGLGSLFKGFNALIVPMKGVTTLLSAGGMLGGMSALTMTGVVGLAVAGVAGLTYGIYKLKNRTEEAEEVNLDMVNSLDSQANKLEKSVDVFDRLTKKTKLSNDELTEMNSLNERINESTNPGVIDELQKKYDELAKKSGLSKEEITKLLKANGDIIEQSPDVVTSVSDQGNEFVKSTEAVKEYISELRDMSQQELADEMIIAQENANDALKERKSIKKSLYDLDLLTQELRKIEAMDEKERNEYIQDRLLAIRKQLRLETTSAEEKIALQAESDALSKLQNESLAEGLKTVQKERDVLNEKLDKTDEEIAKLDEVNLQYANMQLKAAGINEEGNEGLAILDKSITKNHEEIIALEKKKKSSEGLTDEESKRLQKLKETLTDQEKSRLNIFKETGLFNDLNAIADVHLEKLSKKEQKEVKTLADKNKIKLEDGNIIKQIQTQNEKHDEQIKKLKSEKDENGNITQENQNQINKLEGKKSENVKIAKQILGELDLWDDVKKEIGYGNTKIQGQKKSVIEVKSAGERVWDQLKKNNSMTSTGIGLEKDRTAEANKKANKSVIVTPSITAKKLADDLSAKADKQVDLTMNPIRKKFTIPFMNYAKGTRFGGHPGGLAQVNDGVGSNAGPELIKTPDGQMGMFKGKNVFADLPKGTHVLSAKETRNMIPQYAKGTLTAADVGFKAIKTGFSKFITSFAGNTFTPFGKDAIDYARNNLTNTMSSILGSMNPTGPSSKGASAWRPQIKLASATMNANATEREINGIIAQINRESGGNQRIVQSNAVWDVNTAAGNPARGLLQYIPQTFNAYKTRGHGNIYSGYDQLRAFFNNSTWRRDLPYGRRGWGPRGAKRGYETGGLIQSEHMAMLGEDGPEMVIPLNKNRRTDAMKLLALTGRMLGADSGKSKRPSSLPNVKGGNESNALLDAVLKQNEILMKILNKDSNLYIDGDDLTEKVNNKNAIADKLRYI